MLRRVMAVILTFVAIMAAGWLALRRADIPYDTLESSYSIQDTRFLTLADGLKIHYTDTGPRDRSTIVLVHGFSASLHTWLPWKVALETDFRVITLDLPGHGLSRAEGSERATIGRFSEVIDELAEQLSVSNYTIVGSSMGGNTAWVHTLAYPDQVDGLVLIGASGWEEEEGESSTPLLLRLMGNPLARTVLKDLDMSAMVKSSLEQTYVDQNFVTEELVNRYVSLSRAPGHRDTLLTIIANTEDRPKASAEALSEISVPTLIIWGEEDNLVPVSGADKFEAAISGSKKVVYESIGHLPHEEAAEETLEEMLSFMLDVEWNTVDEEEIEPAGDPRLVEDRPVNNGG